MAHSIQDFVTEIWIGTVFEIVEKRSRSCLTAVEELSYMLLFTSE